MMKCIPRGSILCLACAGAFATQSMAQAATTATVTYEIREINEISVSGDPGLLVVSTAAAGDSPRRAFDEQTTWTLTTNGSNKRITGLVDAAMPAGVSLLVTLVAPDGAGSTGEVALSPTAQTLVSQITEVHSAGLRITYTLAATAHAGVIARDQRRVTFTILADS